MYPNYIVYDVEDLQDDGFWREVDRGDSLTRLQNKYIEKNYIIVYTKHSIVTY